jgi:acyl carrier protein
VAILEPRIVLAAAIWHAIVASPKSARGRCRVGILARQSAREETRVKTPDLLRRELRDIIIGDLVPITEDELADDASLVDEVLDSLGIAELAVFIEEEIGRPLDPSEETRATFASVKAVVDFIVTKR